HAREIRTGGVSRWRSSLLLRLVAQVNLARRRCAKRLVAVEEQTDADRRAVAHLPQVGDRRVDVDAAAKPAGAQPREHERIVAERLDVLDVVGHLGPDLAEALEVAPQRVAAADDTLAGQRG